MNTDNFADRLIDAIQKKGAPICVGIDPIVASLPDAVFGGRKEQALGGDGPACVDAIFDFTMRVLKTVAPYVPIVKFQSAYFEQFRHDGVQAYFELIHSAEEMGLLVIGDIKRGDIGSTAQAYAAGHLAEFSVADSDENEVATPDAITVNPMLGMDTLEPFTKAAVELGKGLFVLVRTSNPGSADLQDVKLADGRTWSEMLAERLAVVAAGPGLVGARGWSSVGAVVGATQQHTMVSLRQRLPKSIFLLPGYGAQGATADMTRAAFGNGIGAIVSASRSILYAHKEKKYSDRFKDDWEKCVETATKDMWDDLRRVING